MSSVTLRSAHTRCHKMCNLEKDLPFLSIMISSQYDISTDICILLDVNLKMGLILF